MRGGAWLTRILLILGAVVFMLPIYVMLVMSLKTPAEIDASSPWAWPTIPTLRNFETVLTQPELSFGRLFQNTLVLSVLATLGTVLSSSAAAYPFARLSFPGKDRLFMIVLATMMLPGIVTTIPSYVLFAQIGWVNTFYPLWVPTFFFAGAFNVFLLRQFLMSIPTELDEAAKLDGANHFVIFGRILLPLSGPALGTVAVFAFVGSWRDFMGPLLYLNTNEMETLELGLRTFQTMQKTEWHLLMAASLLVMLPILVIFLACQKLFVQGITLTGGK
ncbi:MAG: carbohydrate ABC transporter permease [Fimbriimonas sp.]